MALFVGPHEVGARTSAVGTVDTGGQATSPAMRLGRPGELAFPVQPTPRCDILDNFGDPRSGGRRHQGIDILATLGQEVYAVADGVLTVQYVDGSSGTSLSGNGWVLTEPEGTYTFYAHLSAFAAGLREGSPVTRGQVIGYVGDTGNPGPGNYHLHFEVHPGGGAAVDPLDVLTIPTQCRIY
jgi:murein DD-endopeptidase MepM/ murein hydrolase activator NlpD